MLVGKVLVGLLGLGLVVWLLREETRGVHVGHASIVGPALLEVQGAQLSLWGIRQPHVDATCDAAAGRWPCGAFAVAALIHSTSSGRVLCFERGASSSGAQAARCYATRNYVIWKDLGRELVRQGWAMPDLRVAHEYLPMATEGEEAAAGLWRRGAKTRIQREME